MAYQDTYGITDPMISDVAKGVTIAVFSSLLLTRTLPDPMSLAVPAAATALYWYTVHRYLP